MDDEAARLKAERKAEKKRKREEEAAKAGAAEAPAEETEEEAKKRRKLEKAARKAQKEMEKMQKIVTAEGKEESIPNPLLSGAKVETYQNGFSEVQFIAAIAKPFSPPGEKLTKKILQLVNEAYKTKSIVNGIKLVRKAVSKGTPSICVLAANVAPLDIISHLPGLLEDHKCPYIWVPSRYELGLACMQKRAVSAVVIKEDGLSESAAATYQKVRKIIKEMHKQLLVGA
jgi:H/ACA ribonucleoprotein complex subunit 2|eukprot:CAMPEP_0174285632 /NCGR_PEP_ID=MMETSP0809-20121228/9119_1 /TAXON_ID=73025 ORGANISM="Eutreptiella gymnastica-like, Strain CCMP1594" /NCGR_SAMPLE_ID=MMETSP0809 /ASSEMBLY_ACC=CAM_ASM_000658 /LENGTH=228 /DNA_ID=CAMNT_0015381451 /DNA_START=21 /DNA_END=707 /DNA_ORIENTATION=+